MTPFRKWSITATVMLITVMQILDTSVTNVALPHIQGALSAGVEETAWVLLLPFMRRVHVEETERRATTQGTRVEGLPAPSE